MWPPGQPTNQMLTCIIPSKIISMSFLLLEEHRVVSVADDLTGINSSVFLSTFVSVVNNSLHDEASQPYFFLSSLSNANCHTAFEVLL